MEWVSSNLSRLGNKLCTVCLLSVSSHTADCLDLPSLMNGMIMYSGGPTGIRFIGSGATYTCNPGYTLIGGTTRVCVSGRIWSGSPPTCQSKLLYSLCFINTCVSTFGTIHVCVNPMKIVSIKFLVDIA